HLSGGEALTRGGVGAACRVPRAARRDGKSLEENCKTIKLLIYLWVVFFRVQQLWNNLVAPAMQQVAQYRAYIYQSRANTMLHGCTTLCIIGTLLLHTVHTGGGNHAGSCYRTSAQ